MGADLLGIAVHGVLRMADEPSRVANPTPVGQMRQDGHRFLLRQAGLEERRAFSLGERNKARLAETHADLFLLAAPTTPAQVSLATLAVIRTG